MIELQQTAAALYLAAGVGALIGISLPSPRASRGAVVGLALGAVVQAVALATLHRQDPVPSLSSPSTLTSYIVFVAMLFLLVFMWRVRLTGLAALAGPLAFLAIFVSSTYSARRAADPVAEAAGGAIPHAHVLLSSAGLALLAVSGLAGVFFLLEHRRLKSKRVVTGAFKLPSLEALDRVNVAALAVGFPLLTLGVVTGSAWLHSVTGRAWSGSHHETWTIIAWGIYAGLAASRFAGRQGARQAAASAVAGFVFLLFAVVGVELLS